MTRELKIIGFDAPHNRHYAIFLPGLFDGQTGGVQQSVAPTFKIFEIARVGNHAAKIGLESVNQNGKSNGIHRMVAPALRAKRAMNQQERDQELALAALRVFMGFNMFMHGAARIFGHLPEFVGKTTQEFVPTILPSPLVHLYATTLPFVELTLGALLLLGLWTRWSLVALLALIASLTFGMSLLQNWSVVGSQIIYAFAFFVLLYLNRPNRFSLDGFLARREGQKS